MAFVEIHMYGMGDYICVYEMLLRMWDGFPFWLPQNMLLIFFYKKNKIGLTDRIFFPSVLSHQEEEFSCYSTFWNMVFMYVGMPSLRMLLLYMVYVCLYLQILDVCRHGAAKEYLMGEQRTKMRSLSATYYFIFLLKWHHCENEG